MTSLALGIAEFEAELRVFYLLHRVSLLSDPSVEGIQEALKGLNV